MIIGTILIIFHEVFGSSNVHYPSVIEFKQRAKDNNLTFNQYVEGTTN